MWCGTEEHRGPDRGRKGTHGTLASRKRDIRVKTESLTPLPHSILSPSLVTEHKNVLETEMHMIDIGSLSLAPVGPVELYQDPAYQFELVNSARNPLVPATG